MNTKYLLFGILTTAFLTLAACTNDTGDGLYEGIHRTDVTPDRSGIHRTDVTPDRNSIHRTDVTPDRKN